MKNAKLVLRQYRRLQPNLKVGNRVDPQLILTMHQILTDKRIQRTRTLQVAEPGRDWMLEASAVGTAIIFAAILYMLSPLAGVQ
jgi:hypothetical protein